MPAGSPNALGARRGDSMLPRGAVRAWATAAQPRSGQCAGQPRRPACTGAARFLSQCGYRLPHPRDASLRLARRNRKIAAMNDTTHHEGWLAFAGIMILIAAVLNCIWGIAAIDKANFTGGSYGRWVGIISASLAQSGRSCRSPAIRSGHWASSSSTASAGHTRSHAARGRRCEFTSFG